ncbi:methyltransferase [Nanoarchaeota archaeon]
MKFQEMDQVRKSQVRRQVTEFENRFQGQEYDITDIVIRPDLTLEKYRIHRGTFQSDRMAAVVFAGWIADNPEEYQGKSVIDMFCGGGIQGIVALLRGAEHVTFADISTDACQDTEENLAFYGLQGKATVVKSDLFQGIDKPADLIIANPPFFPCEPIEGKPISATMCMPTEKLEEFYRDARNYGPRIVLSHWDFAGTENDPAVLGPKFDWQVEKKLLLPTGYGLQTSAKESHFKVDLLTR